MQIGIGCGGALACETWTKTSEGLEVRVVRRELVRGPSPLTHDSVGVSTGCGRRIGAKTSRWQDGGDSALGPIAEYSSQLEDGRACGEVLGKRSKAWLTSFACPT